MSSQRAQQKKLEKKKKQRLAAQAQRRAATAGPPSLNVALRQAAAAPFGRAFMSASWRSEEPELVTVVMTRTLADGSLVAGMVLVDRTCLGVKNGFAKYLELPIALEALVADIGDAHESEMEEVSVLEAQSVVFSAIDYAKSLGFAPHRDFPEAVFGPRPDALLDTPLARPERPLYIPGPTDDVVRIMRTIEPKGGVLLGG